MWQRAVGNVRNGCHPEIDVRDHVAVDQRAPSEGVWHEPDCVQAALPHRDGVAVFPNFDTQQRGQAIGDTHHLEL